MSPSEPPTHAGAARTAPRSERVDLPGRATDVHLGTGLLPTLWAALRARFPDARRCGLAVDAQVARLWRLPPAPADLEVLDVELPAGEAAKDRATLERLQDRWIELRRDEPVVVVGGGAALDVGGLAAALLRRGLPWIAVATTVVAMADASVGGKTAVNHPRGKNLLGTFHPPVLVLSDVATLATLDERDRVAGLAEVYKCARIADAGLLAALRAGPPCDPEAWVRTLHAAVAVKARLVEADERDLGVRRLLNYGHTVGHALERVLGPEALRHGEGVAIGMDRAAAVAVGRGLLDDAGRAAQRADLERLGLPVALPPGTDADALADALGLDKKRKAGAAHVMVLPVGAQGARVAEDVSDAELRAALD